MSADGNTEVTEIYRDREIVMERMLREKQQQRLTD